MKVEFFFPQIAHCDKSISLFWLSIFSTISFIAFAFVILSDLNSNRNNFVEILFIKVFF